MSRLLPALFVLFAATWTPGAFGDECFGPGDVNHDSVVDSDDGAILARCLSGPGITAVPEACRSGEFYAADVDEDDDVDLLDASRLLQRFGQEYFDYGPHRENTEAEILAIELSGEIRAPDVVYARIQRDLALIRSAYPGLEAVVDRPDVPPRRMLVYAPSDPAPPAYDDLNRFYQVTGDSTFVYQPTLHVLTFCDNLNIPLVAEDYMAAPGVGSAYPAQYIGDGHQVLVEREGELYRYAFVPCFGDYCHTSGGVNQLTCVFEVDDAGTVVRTEACTESCVDPCP